MSGSPESKKPYLEERIVYCANCDGNRLLQASSRGPVCATCASLHWMYLPNAIAPLTHAAPVEKVAAKLPDNVSNALMEKVAEQKRAKPRLRLVG